MQDLILLIEELIFVPITATTLAGMLLIGLCISGAAELLLLRLRRIQRKRTAQANGSNLLGRFRPFLYASWIFAGLFLGLLASTALINQIFFNQGINWALARVQQHSGTVINYKSVTGDIFAGRIEFSGLSARRGENKTADFEFKAHSVIVDLAFPGIPFMPAHLEQVLISGASGVQRRAQTAHGNSPRKKAFHIDHLHMENVSFQILDQTSPNDALSTEIALTTLDSKPLRSDLALFDILFHSEASGWINDQTFIIESQRGALARSHWYTEPLDLRTARLLIGPPFDQFDEGTVSIAVKARQQTQNKGNAIETQWQINLHGLQGASAPNPAPVQAITFDLLMTEKEFVGADSLYATGMPQAVSAQCVKTLDHILNKDATLRPN